MFQQAMNVIDLVAIIPFYLNILLEGLEDFEIIGNISFSLALKPINIQWIRTGSQL